MAKLQKKKSAGVKKKAPESPEEKSSGRTGSGTAVISTTRTSNVSGDKKPVAEKYSGDIKKGDPNFFQKAVDFFREVKVELKKVTWPTRKQTTGTTIVVIVFVIVVSIFLGIFDYALSKLVQVVLT